MPALRRLLLPLLGLGLAAVVSGCAAGTAAPVEWRVMVKLARPAAAADELVRHAARTSGVAVRYLAASSPELHALGLRCGDEAACREAVQRLKADTAYFLAVERDERRRAHEPASHPS
ncbi:MAG: hypothetical protein KF891_24825 [Rhizobacter sp.]|nr:hypothetical protein [Rhizobacter sp.]